MNDNLITEIIDLNKVKINLLELQKMWEQLIVSMAAKSSKDLRFDDLTRNLSTVTTAENELTKSKQLSLEIDKKKVKLTAEIIANYEKYSKEEQEIIENEIKRRAKVAEVNKELKERFTNEQNLIKVLQRETKTIADLDKQNKDLQRIQQKLNITTKEGQEANAKINAQIEKNKQTIKEYTNVIDAQRRNIGNYPTAMEKAGSSVAKFGAGMVAAFAAVGMAIRQAYSAIEDSIKLFIEQEKQSVRVNKAFGDYAATINRAADETQRLTGVGNEQYQKLAILAKSYGIVSKDVNQVVQDAIGLSVRFEAAGISQEQAIKMMAQAQFGNYTALQKIIPELKTVNTEQEKMAILTKLAAEGFETAKDYANTYGGKLQQIKSAMGDLKETIGKGVLTGLFSVEEGNKAIDFINQLNEAIEKSGIIEEYFKQIREAAAMMIEPFQKILKTFGIASDTGSMLTYTLQGLAKMMQFAMTPAKVLWSSLGTLVDVAISVYNGFKNIKDIKIQDVFDLIKRSVANLLSPVADLIGLTNELNDLLGVQSERVSLTQEEYEKLNKMMFNTKEAFKDYREKVEKAAQEQSVLNAEIQAEKEAIEEANKAKEEAAKRYSDYIANVKKANEEAKLSIALGENHLEVKKKEIEAIYNATKAYFELNGYTNEEIKRLKELRAEIDKLNEAIANSPKLISKTELKSIENAAAASSEIAMNLRDVRPAVNDSAAGINDLELAVTRLRNTFNHFYATDIEDWRDTMKESIEAVLSESLKLYNQIIDIQSSQLEKQLGNIKKIYDKQMEGLDSVYDRRKKLLEATIDDEKQLAAELARIEEEKAAVQAKFLDEKIKKEEEIARKKAILEKRRAEVEIATGSATALVEAIKLIGIATTTAAPGDPYSLVARIAAALAAALTVVSAVTAGIAKVKAIEIPQFYEGGEVEAGQLISVAEKGQELAITESGKAYMFEKQGVIVTPEKMRIFSNKETKQILEKQTVNNNYTYEKQSNVSLTISVDKERYKKYFKLN